MQHLLSRALGTAVALTLALGGTADAHPIDWSSFDRALPNLGDDCDIVIVDHQANEVDPKLIEIRVEQGPLVSWWKGIGVVASSGKYYEVNTPTGRRADSMLLDAAEVQSAKYIQLGKAKFLGIHTGVYELADLTPLQGGDRVVFRWVQDSCVQFSGGLIKSASTFPTWMQPGKTEHVTATIGNYGSPWDPETRITFNVDKAFGVIPPLPLTQYTPPNLTLGFAPNQTDGTATFEFDLTAPSSPGKYRITATLNQQGGHGAVVLDRTIEVAVTQPPPPSNPVTPVYLKVPSLLYRNLEDAVKELATVGLPAPIIYGEDPSLPRDKQVITGQYPIGGTSVISTFRVALDVTPPGYSTFSVFNCDRNRTTYTLWGYGGDRWYEIDKVPSRFGDGGVCPPYNATPVEHTLASGQYETLVITDPLRCTKGDDPSDPACRAYEVVLRGQTGGAPYPTVYVE